ncbi:MAG: hypothetical protein IJF92_02515 [Bacilli bacterium]|nr:hypothetical protein [Bacilli bacterium]
MKYSNSKYNKFNDITNNIIELNKISHAYLIEVNNYEEDIEIIKEFIKKILLNKSNLDKLSKSEEVISNQINNDQYIDLTILESDGAWIKKNQLLELKEDYQNKSLLDNKKIYVIKEAEKLNPASANTILKFLEEPEEGIIAILLTSNRYKILDTIISRCQVLSLKSNDVNIEVDEDTLYLLDNILKKEELFINYKSIYEKIIDKEKAREKFNTIEELLVNYLDYKVLNKEVFNSDIIKMLGKTTDKEIIKIISIIEEYLPKLVYNVNYKLWLDAIFSELVEV